MKKAISKQNATLKAPDFRAAVKTILATNKQQSDAQMEALQASNRIRREAKKAG